MTECNIRSVCEYLLRPGVEYIIEDNAEGCESYQQIVDECLVSVDESIPNKSFSIFPNPAKGKVQVVSQTGLDIEEVVIINQFGQNVATPTAGNEVDVSGLAPGIYFLKVELAGNYTMHKLIVSN